MKNGSLTIGIPIRNEAKSLQLLIRSLINAVKTVQEALPELKIETLFCANDTVDNSREIIKNLAFVNPLNSRLLESEPGKMNALIQIVQQRSFKNGMVCFIDADIELEKNCLLSLVRGLESNKKVFLVYSSVRPKQVQKLNLLQKLQGIHYVLRKNVSPRKYFHGRTYLMRSSALLERDLRSTSEYSSWELESGPCVDDIYLSRVIIHEYGLGSLKEIPEAKIYFSPPRTLRDFYLGQRRLCLEIKRLDLLYPEQEDTLASELKDGMIVHVMSNGQIASANEVAEMTFGNLHVNFITNGMPLPERKSVSAVFLVGFIDGQIIAARNERGWDVPGGHVEPNDPDIFATLQREAMEESGVTVKTAVPYALLRFEGRDDQMLFYASNDCTLGEFTPSPDAFERQLMATDEFISVYHWKKDVMELLIERALLVYK